jgi:probable HAF family extracellular repeat protein
MRARAIVVTAVLTMATVGFATPAHAATGYRVVDLGTFGGRSSIAYGINDAGQVVGVAQFADGSGDAFLWSSGSGLKPLGFGPAPFGQAAALGIDDTGRVVGSSPGSQGFVWDPVDGVLPLGTLGGSGSSAVAIDATGGIVGSSYLAGDTSRHAFLTAGPGSPLVDLGTLGGPMSSAAAVNAFGQVAGTSYWAATPDATSFEEHAVLWSDGRLTDLGTFPSTQPRAWSYGINDAGSVVGMSLSGPRLWWRAFLWQPSTGMVDLGWLPDKKGNQHSWAYDINDAGQVVGLSNGRAFLWSAGSMVDLNTLIPKTSGWVLERAHAINDAGWIVGQGQIRQRTHAFLLIPNP